METKKIYIVGGNGFARECYTYVDRMCKSDSTITFAGFLGEGGYEPELFEFSKFWKGDVSNHEFKEDEYAVIGSGDCEIRKRIYESLKSRNVKFFTVIDPSVIVYPYVEMGEANIFSPNCLVSSQVKIGNCNLFNGFIFIGHDAQIGDFNFRAPHTQILGNVKLQDMNAIGTSSVLLPKAKIGSYNKVAPISAIYKGCKDNCIMSGNPARKIGENNEDCSD